MNEILPMRWTGIPVYPSDPPDDFDRDPCVWYWYKDPADIPARLPRALRGVQVIERVFSRKPPSMPIVWPVT